MYKRNSLWAPGSRIWNIKVSRLCRWWQAARGKGSGGGASSAICSWDSVCGKHAAEPPVHLRQEPALAGRAPATANGAGVTPPGQISWKCTNAFFLNREQRGNKVYSIYNKAHLNNGTKMADRPSWAEAPRLILMSPFRPGTQKFIQSWPASRRQ